MYTLGHAEPAAPQPASREVVAASLAAVWPSLVKVGRLVRRHLRRTVRGVRPLDLASALRRAIAAATDARRIARAARALAAAPSWPLTCELAVTGLRAPGAPHTASSPT